METFIKSILPKSIWGRCLLILSAPLLLVQIGLLYVFFERHTETILRLNAQNIAGDAAVVAKIYEIDPGFAKKIATTHFKFHFQNDQIIGKNSWLVSFLNQAFKDHVRNAYHISLLEDDVCISIKTKKGLICFTTPAKRLLSRTTFLVFVVTFLVSVFALLIAALFMKRQINPIRKLSKAAQQFGCGNFDHVKPSGAIEVRHAIISFNEMSDKIKRHISERLEMIAALSHDLRTPLTRLKLRLACMPKNQESLDLASDIDEMHKMIETFLLYARSQAQEQLSSIHALSFLDSFKPHVPLLSISCQSDIVLKIRPILFKRCLNNLFDNAMRFAKNIIHIQIKDGEKSVTFTIDDDGPGIDQDQREAVFKPFYHLDKSRNFNNAGVGLGLSIVRDIVSSHGGTIVLERSPQKGLRVIFEIPKTS